MDSSRQGRQSLLFLQPPSILSYASAVGKKESEGPLGNCFDFCAQDTTLGQKSWEKAETALQRTAISLALQKAGLTDAAIDAAFLGDLLNQCVGSSFTMRNLGVPTLGLYGACSTMAEGLLLAGMAVSGGFCRKTLTVSSSHFASSERQYRFPLNYGGQRTPTAQWTVTGAGAVVLGEAGEGLHLCSGTIGTIVDRGITDASNMGAAMAPEDVNLDPYIFRCAERCVLHKIRYYHNHLPVFPLERTETENRQSHLIPYLTSSGILSAQMFFLSKHRR